MKSIIWGIVLVAVGVLLGGDAAGLFDFNIFFDGWWTLFIIVPCFVGMITEKGERVGNLIGLIVGILLLLACQDVIDFDLLWKLLVPAIIVIVGLTLIFKSAFNKQINAKIKELNNSANSEDEMAAVFSGQNIDMKGETFKGKKISAVFGGFKLDLRKAKIEEDVVINASAVFGGIDILVPDDVIVKVKSNSLFGGVKSKKNDGEGKHTIYINGSAVFGGIEIK